MGLEKVLQKIQLQVKELAPTLELFIDDSIQPSVSDCEALQHQLNQLQENVAIYKFHKKEKELSPSFNIHVKVSEKDPVRVQEKVNIQPEIEDKFNEQTTDSHKEKTIDPGKKILPLTIGINDKFRFINELFKQNNAEYNIALEQLSGLQSWAETEVYLNSLKGLYEWKESSDVVVYFYSLAKKRFT